MILSEYNAFVQPIINPELSAFCTELTSISQQDVDHAKRFTDVIAEFKKWIDMDEDYLLCSWGHYDKNQLKDDSRIHALDTKWIDQHISLKHQYADFKKLRRPIGMGAALRAEGLELEGMHHRGMDDARNISKIFLKYFDHWQY